MRLSNVKEAVYLRLNILTKQLCTQNSHNFSQGPEFGTKPESSEIENELNSLINTLGKEAFYFVYKNVLGEIDWLKLDSQIIKSYYQNIGALPRSIRFLSSNIEKALKNEAFEDFIADIINCMPLFKKLTPDNLISMVKNLFLLISVIGNLDEERQVMLSLGFIYSGLEFYYLVGHENLLTLVKHLIKNVRLSFVTTDILQKVLVFLIGNHEKKLKEEKEMNFMNQDQVSLVKSQILTYKTLIKNLSREISSEERLNKGSINDEKQDQLSEQIKIESLTRNMGPSYLTLLYSKDLKENKLININLTEQRLAELIIQMLNFPTYQEEKEQRLLQKMFFRSLNLDFCYSIDDESDKKQMVSWNVDQFYEKNKPQIDQLSHEKVFSFLDHPEFKISDKKTLDLFVSILQKFKISNLLVSYLIKSPWVNIDNQISILSFLLSNINDVIKTGNKIKKNNNYELMINVKPSAINTFLFEVWTSLDIISGLLKIGVDENMSKVKPLFDWPIANIPEMIVLSLFQVNRDNFLHWELLKDTFPLFLSNHLNSAPLLEDLWIIDPNRLIETLAMLNFSMPDVVNTSKILDITQKVKDSLIPMVSSKYDNFSIGLAVLAVKRDFLHLDPWLADQIERKGDEFILPLLNFLSQNVIQEYNKKIALFVAQNGKNPLSGLATSYIPSQLKQGIKQNFSNSPPRKDSNMNVMSSINPQNSNSAQFNPPLKGIPSNNYTQIKDAILEKSQLTIEALVIIFESLNQNTLKKNTKVSKETYKEIAVIYKQVFEIFEEMQAQPSNSEETEEKANLVFRKLFNEETTVKALAQQMKVYKESANKKENEIFACMIHSMLDEYRFFNKYPDKELILMGSLFGKIIEMKLIDGIIESIALKYILDGFRKGGKMVIFSYKALEQFIDKIKNWPFFLEEVNKLTKNYQGQGEIYDQIASKYNEYVRQSESSGINMSNNIIGASQINYNLNQNPNNTMNSQNMNFQQMYGNQPNYHQGYMGNSMNSGMGNSQSFNQGQNFNSRGMSNIPNNMNSSMNYQPMNINNKQMKNNKFNTQDNIVMNNQGNNYMVNSYMNINQSNNSNSSSTQNAQSQIPQTSLSTASNAYTPSYLMQKSQLNTNQVPYNPQVNKKILTPSTNKLNTSNGSAKDESISQGIQMQGMPSSQTPQTSKLSTDFNEKMNVIFLKLSNSNIVEKAMEIKFLITNELILKYFSNYLIAKRVCLEKDRLFIFYDLVNLMDLKLLFSQMTKDTITIARKLISSDDLSKDQNQKIVLKNLGTWLGLITLNRNRPILNKEINLKELLVEGYQNGKLLVFISFVTRILEGSIKSKVFHQKNPYILGLLNLLLEFYHSKKIAQNAKFEIELFFKKLESDPSKQIPATNILSKLKPSNDNQDFKKEEETVKPQPLIDEKRNSMEASVEEIGNLVKKCDKAIEGFYEIIRKNSNESKETIIQVLINCLVTSINQILSLVVERTVNISLITTRDLVIKDLAYDSDAKRFKQAATNSIKSLSGSLAIVTCKDPLRIGFLNALKEKFSKKEIDAEQAKANDYLNEILDTGCFYIQNFVISKAIDKIEQDQLLHSQIEMREKGIFLESQSSYLSSLEPKINLLPQPLRPLTTGLTNDQFKIYEDFDKLCLNAFSSTNINC